MASSPFIYMLLACILAGEAVVVQVVDRAALVLYHNIYRCMHGLQPLVWDFTIAANARAWAANCTGQHTPNATFGENIYGSIYYLPRADEVANGWYSEISNFDFSTFTAQSKAARFTQLVWASTTRFGCSACTADTNWQYYICQYSPAGNQGDYSTNVFPAIKSIADCTPSASPTTSTTVCVDSPPDWQDTWGDGCDDYYNNYYCDADGTVGDGWSTSTFGSFNDYATGGKNASVACCACGGGVLVPASPSPSPSLSSSPRPSASPSQSPLSASPSPPTSISPSPTSASPSASPASVSRSPFRSRPPSTSQSPSVLDSNAVLLPNDSPSVSRSPRRSPAKSPSPFSTNPSPSGLASPSTTPDPTPSPMGSPSPVPSSSPLPSPSPGASPSPLATGKIGRNAEDEGAFSSSSSSGHLWGLLGLLALPPTIAVVVVLFIMRHQESQWKELEASAALTKVHDEDKHDDLESSIHFSEIILGKEEANNQNDVAAMLQDKHPVRFIHPSNGVAKYGQPTSQSRHSALP